MGKASRRLSSTRRDFTIQTSLPRSAVGERKTRTVSNAVSSSG